VTQSRRHSVLESVANVAIGYGVALAGQLLVFPLFGLHPRLADNLGIGACFTAISLARSYAIRRLFNRWHGPVGDRRL
jgi:hypothetical protein